MTAWPMLCQSYYAEYLSLHPLVLHATSDFFFLCMALRVIVEIAAFE